MRKLRTFIMAMLVIAMAVSVAACGKKSDNSLVGVWEYADTESDLGAVYDLKEDGTGTYTIKVGETEVTYELKYEVKDGHLLVTYVNNETFTEDDVFDSEFTLQDASTMIIKDSAGMEMTFKKK